MFSDNSSKGTCKCKDLLKKEILSESESSLPIKENGPRKLNVVLIKTPFYDKRLREEDSNSDDDEDNPSETKGTSL